MTESSEQPKTEPRQLLLSRFDKVRVKGTTSEASVSEVYSPEEVLIVFANGNAGRAFTNTLELVERRIDPTGSAVDHPNHYGGKDNPYECIKVIEAWGLGFNLGNLLKYVSRAGKKDSLVEDLKKARWYLDREIAKHG